MNILNIPPLMLGLVAAFLSSANPIDGPIFGPLHWVDCGTSIQLHYNRVSVFNPGEWITAAEADQLVVDLFSGQTECQPSPECSIGDLCEVTVTFTFSTGKLVVPWTEGAQVSYAFTNLDLVISCSGC